MKLSLLLNCVQHEKVIGYTDVEIYGVCADSRYVQKGDAFFSYVGGEVDSHEFIEQAIENGAVVVFCQYPILGAKCVQVIVSDGRMAMTQSARAFYGFADKKLKIIAVTGTNGKTTTTYMLDAIFKKAGKKTGVIGTLGIIYNDIFIDPELTTPDPIYLHKVLKDMVNDGVEYVFMEVSAHAIWYNKIKGIKFEVGIFTNCTQDHLDFFGNMREYAECKMQMFTRGICKYSVVNIDDKIGLEIAKKSEKVLTYALEAPSDVFALDEKSTIYGSNFVLNCCDDICDIKLNLVGRYNIYNAMGAITAAWICGIDMCDITEGLLSLNNVNGRLERIADYNGAEIFVDFAHTPDGLESSLKTLKGLCQGKLYCLFGCGGNRDKLKRPIMGEIATNYSDFCIITSDNPRYEDAFDIICQIESGIKGKSNKYVTITDRTVAIQYAIKLLNKGDILLVAGKGGENYQDIMGIKHNYNDNTVIKGIIGN